MILRTSYQAQGDWRDVDHLETPTILFMFRIPFHQIAKNRQLKVTHKIFGNYQVDVARSRL